MNEEKFKKIIKNIEKEYGKNALIQLNDKKNLFEYDVISSGSILLDDAIGIGGYPRGRIIEIFGPESSGKTTMALLAIAEAQKKKGYAAFIDVEHAIDIKHAEKLGVDLNTIVISQPNSGEEALELVDYLCSTNEFAIIVIDSVAALSPLVELEGRMEDQTIGAQARLMSKSMRKLSSTISKTNTLVVFINQLREKTGVIFGNPEVTPGGRALKFFSSIRIDIRIRERIKNDKEIIGQKIKIKVVKNKMASPYKEIETIINYSFGIDKIFELIDLAMEKNIIKKSGSWYYYKEKNIGQGKNEVKNYIESKKLYDEIYKILFEI